MTLIINFLKKIKTPLKHLLLKKKYDEIDRSTLYNFDDLLQLLRTDVANLELLGKSAADPQY